MCGYCGIGVVYVNPISKNLSDAYVGFQCRLTDTNSIYQHLQNYLRAAGTIIGTFTAETSLHYADAISDDKNVRCRYHFLGNSKCSHNVIPFILPSL